MLHFPSFQIEETSLRMQRIPYGPVPDNFDMRNISAYAENTVKSMVCSQQCGKHLCVCREYYLFPSCLSSFPETSLRLQRIPLGELIVGFGTRKHLCACREYPLLNLERCANLGNISAHAENTISEPGTLCESGKHLCACREYHF